MRELLITPEGNRIYGHDFSIHEGSGLYGGFAEHLELLPGSKVYRLREDRPADELTFFEPLSCAVTWVAPVRQSDIVVVEVLATWAWPPSWPHALPVPRQLS